MYQYFIGIDISKDNFATALRGQTIIKTYLNNLEGFSMLFKEYESYLKNGLVILETTGGYELSLIDYLQSKSCAVHRASSPKVKYFIRSYGKLAKSDGIDALSLAHYGYERHLTLELYKENTQDRLYKLVQRRMELKDMLVQEKNRRQAPNQGFLKQSFDMIIKALEEELFIIGNAIDDLCKKTTHLEEKKKILKSIKGIGDVIAIELLALLPELGMINRKQIASLGGVAPHPNESGKKIGYRSTRGGRSQIKPILFMAALSATRSHSSLSEFYNRLLKAGKKKMVALTALMRKILVMANAKIRDFLALQPDLQHG